MTHGNRKRNEILVAGLAMWPNVSARAIGRAVHLSHSAVLYHFKNSDDLAMSIARYAIETDASKVIVQLLASDHPAVSDMSPELRRRYFKEFS
jgi:AcrR family transcriptional regulator